MNLLPYDPNACDCCGCPPPAFEYQRRTATVARYGEPGFTDATTFFRTRISRGWGIFTPITPVFDAARQSYTACGAGTACSGTTTYYTAGCIDAYAPFEIACEAAEDDPSCGTDFVGLTASSNTHALAPALGPPTYSVPIEPRGEQRLANEITATAFVEEVRACARAASWVSDTGDPLYGNFIAAYQRKTGNIASLAVKQTRFRFRHRIPVTGAYRVTWEIWFQPRTWDGSAWVEGTATKQADCSAEWDGVTPGGYEAGNSATWPVSPWFELPEPDADGGWTLRALAVACDAVPTPTAPDGLQSIPA